MNPFTVFKKRKDLKPLPAYPSIAFTDIPKASTLLFYGGVKLTELVGNNVYGHPYNPPAFHAAFHCEEGLFLNVGAYRTIQLLNYFCRSTRRIDVIIYKDLSKEQQEQARREAYLNVSKPKGLIALPDYGWKDFLRFGLPFLKPSKKQFCSENVVLLFGKVGYKVSDLKPEDTAPWDLYEYALKHPELCEIRTAWIGADFKY